MFRGGAREAADLWLDFDDWRQGSLGVEPSFAGVDGAAAGGDAILPPGGGEVGTFALPSTPPFVLHDHLFLNHTGCAMVFDTDTLAATATCSSWPGRNASAAAAGGAPAGYSSSPATNTSYAGVLWYPPPPAAPAAVFHFLSLYVGPAVVLSARGSRPLTLVSRTSIVIDAPLVAAPGTLGGFGGGLAPDVRALPPLLAVRPAAGRSGHGTAGAFQPAVGGGGAALPGRGGDDATYTRAMLSAFGFNASASGLLRLTPVDVPGIGCARDAATASSCALPATAAAEIALLTMHDMTVAVTKALDGVDAARTTPLSRPWAAILSAVLSAPASGMSDAVLNVGNAGVEWAACMPAPGANGSVGWLPSTMEAAARASTGARQLPPGGRTGADDAAWNWRLTAAARAAGMTASGDAVAAAAALVSGTPPPNVQGLRSAVPGSCSAGITVPTQSPRGCQAVDGADAMAAAAAYAVAAANASSVATALAAAPAYHGTWTGVSAANIRLWCNASSSSSAAALNASDRCATEVPGTNVSSTPAVAADTSVLAAATSSPCGPACDAVRSIAFTVSASTSPLHGVVAVSLTAGSGQTIAGTWTVTVEAPGGGGSSGGGRLVSRGLSPDIDAGALAAALTTDWPAWGAIGATREPLRVGTTAGWRWGIIFLEVEGSVPQLTVNTSGVRGTGVTVTTDALFSPGASLLGSVSLTWRRTPTPPLPVNATAAVVQAALLAAWQPVGVRAVTVQVAAAQRCGVPPSSGATFRNKLHTLTRLGAYAGCVNAGTGASTSWFVTLTVAASAAGTDARAADVLVSAAFPTSPVLTLHGGGGWPTATLPTPGLPPRPCAAVSLPGLASVAVNSSHPAASIAVLVMAGHVPELPHHVAVAALLPLTTAPPPQPAGAAAAPITVPLPPLPHAALPSPLQGSRYAGSSAWFAFTTAAGSTGGAGAAGAPGGTAAAAAVVSAATASASTATTTTTVDSATLRGGSGGGSVGATLQGALEAAERYAAAVSGAWDRYAAAWRLDALAGVADAARGGSGGGGGGALQLVAAIDVVVGPSGMLAAPGGDGSSGGGAGGGGGSIVVTAGGAVVVAGMVTAGGGAGGAGGGNGGRLPGGGGGGGVIRLAGGSVELQGSAVGDAVVHADGGAGGLVGADVSVTAATLAAYLTSHGYAAGVPVGWGNMARLVVTNTSTAAAGWRGSAGSVAAASPSQVTGGGAYGRDGVRGGAMGSDAALRVTPPAASVATLGATLLPTAGVSILLPLGISLATLNSSVVSAPRGALASNSTPYAAPSIGAAVPLPASHRTIDAATAVYVAYLNASAGSAAADALARRLATPYVDTASRSWWGPRAASLSPLAACSAAATASSGTRSNGTTQVWARSPRPSRVSLYVRYDAGTTIAEPPTTADALPRSVADPATPATGIAVSAADAAAAAAAADAPPQLPTDTPLQRNAALHIALHDDWGTGWYNEWTDANLGAVATTLARSAGAAAEVALWHGVANAGTVGDGGAVRYVAANTTVAAAAAAAACSSSAAARSGRAAWHGVYGGSGGGALVPFNVSGGVLAGVAVVGGEWHAGSGYADLPVDPVAGTSAAGAAYANSLRRAAMAGEWTKVDFYLDWRAHTYTLRLNDVTVVRSAPFRGAALTRLGLYAPSRAGAAAVWYDEVYVGEDDSMGWECPAAAGPPPRADDELWDAARGSARNTNTGRPTLVRSHIAPAADWLVRDVGVPTAYSVEQQHVNHVRNRQMYMHESHAGLVYYDGAPHRYYHSDMPLPVARLPYLWPAPQAGLTPGTPALAGAVPWQDALRVPFLDDGDVVHPGAASVADVFTDPASPAIGVYDGGAAGGAAHVERVPASNTLAYERASALAYPVGPAATEYLVSLTSTLGAVGAGTGAPCRLTVLPAAGYRALLAAAHTAANAAAAAATAAESRDGIQAPWNATVPPLGPAAAAAMAGAGYVMVGWLDGGGTSGDAVLYNCSMEVDRNGAAAAALYGPQWWHNDSGVLTADMGLASLLGGSTASLAAVDPARATLVQSADGRSTSLAYGADGTPRGDVPTARWTRGVNPGALLRVPTVLAEGAAAGSVGLGWPYLASTTTGVDGTVDMVWVAHGARGLGPRATYDAVLQPSAGEGAGRGQWSVGEPAARPPPAREYWYAEYDNAWRGGWDAGRWYASGGIGACSSDDFVAWRNEGVMLHFANVSGPTATSAYDLLTRPTDFDAVPGAAPWVAAAGAASATAGGYAGLPVAVLAAAGMLPLGDAVADGGRWVTAAVANGSRVVTPVASLFDGALRRVTASAGGSAGLWRVERPKVMTHAVRVAVAAGNNGTDSLLTGLRDLDARIAVATNTSFPVPTVGNTTTATNDTLALSHSVFFTPNGSAVLAPTHSIAAALAANARTLTAAAGQRPFTSWSQSVTAGTTAAVAANASGAALPTGAATMPVATAVNDLTRGVLLAACNPSTMVGNGSSNSSANDNATSSLYLSAYVMWFTQYDAWYVQAPNVTSAAGRVAQLTLAPRFRLAGVAVALHPAGPYVFLHALLPDGNETVDLTVLAAAAATVAPNANTTADDNDGALTLPASSPPPAHLVRTYFATTRYLLPAPVMQPVWESVKRTRKTLPHGGAASRDEPGGVINPLIFTSPGWYNSSDWSLYNEYSALTGEDDQDFALSYHRAHYAAGYDNPKDIYLQQWRRETRRWLMLSGYWQESWDSAAQRFVLTRRTNVTDYPAAAAGADIPAGIPPPFDPTEAAYLWAGDVMSTAAATALDAYIDGATSVSYTAAEREGVLNALLDQHTFRQYALLGRDPIVSRYLDPRDPTLSGWRPWSVPTVKAQPYFYNARDGNVVDNPIHATIPDLLIAPWQVVEQRRTKAVATTRLHASYLFPVTLVATAEGMAADGAPLADLLASAAYRSAAGTTAGDDAFGWTAQRVETPAGYIDPASALVRRSGDGVAPPAPAPASTWGADVYGSDAPFYFTPADDWYHRFWQFNASYSDRWYDFRNFRDRQSLPAPGVETCTDIHHRVVLQYAECGRVLRNETVWGDTPAITNYVGANVSYSRALNTDAYEACLAQHAELLRAFEDCTTARVPAFDALPAWDVGNRECVGGGGVCGPSFAPDVHQQGLGAPYDSAVPPPQAWQALRAAATDGGSPPLRASSAALPAAAVPYVGSRRFNASQYAGVAWDADAEVVTVAGVPAPDAAWAVPSTLPPPCLAAGGVAAPCNATNLDAEASIMRAPTETERDLADEDDAEKGVARIPPESLL